MTTRSESPRQMRTYRIPKTDLVVSRLALGIGMLGVSWNRSDLVQTTMQAIRVAYDSGITLFDTADVYAEGQSEEALGRVLKQSPEIRGSIAIQSKCGVRLRRGWMPSDPVTEDTFGADLSRDHIVSAVEGSLRRLGTERMDLLLLHATSALVQPEEVARAFDELSGGGKVSHFGVCMHTAAQIELLQKYVRQPLLVNQIWLGLAHNWPIAETSGFGALVDYCRVHDIQVQAFSPLKGQGLFQRPTLLDPPADAPNEVRRLAQALVEIAQRHWATPAAVMLAWLLRHPAGVLPIIGASTPDHIVENCIADRIELERAEWELLLHLAAPIQNR